MRNAFVIFIIVFALWVWSMSSILYRVQEVGLKNIVNSIWEGVE
jgi:hypothetical protein